MKSHSRLLALGLRDYRSGRLRQAANACREVLRRSPQEADALHLLARVATASGDSELASALLARVIQVRGATAPLCSSLAHAFRRRGDIARSSACFRQALELDPASVDIRFEYGQNLMVEKRFEEAIEVFAETLQLDPRHVPARARLACILQILGRPEDALAGLDAVLLVAPHDSFALLQRARVLCQLDRMEESAIAFEEALRCSPNLPDANAELGAVLRELGRHTEARKQYERAIALDPDHADAHWNLALLDLLTGRFTDGWAGYEWRLRRDGGIDVPEPQWDGAALNGRTIMLHAEQGYGDAIQFVRYAPMVRERGGVVGIACRPALESLFRRARGISSVNSEGASCHTALMSLPRLFETTGQTVPADVPYIESDPAVAGEWRERLNSSMGLRRIGVAWAGSPEHANDGRRSLTPHHLRALAGVRGVQWFNLQKGQPAVPPLAPLPRELSDFADTAALIMNLDLVISVDTAVAHLAGALGKPVWLLVPFAPDWRWMLDRTDSPWYPTMRLFRQRLRGDWDAVLCRVRDDLENWI